MTNSLKNNEALSATVDNEPTNSALSDIIKDEEQFETWKNYHLIGDVIRGDAPEEPSWDIANSVALALENEPAHQGSSNANVVELLEAQPTPAEAKQSQPSWLSKALKQFSQVGIAACVAFVAILSVQNFNGSGDSVGSDIDSEIPVLQTIPLNGSAEPVSFTRNDLQPTASVEEVEMKRQEQREKINAVLQDYELQLRLNQPNTNQ